jgi:PadR family transcriptional regulator PadR
MRGEVIKNHLELLVLTALKTEPGHGYSIIRAVRDRSDGECELLEGSLYPALDRLERDRVVTSS